MTMRKKRKPRTNANAKLVDVETRLIVLEDCERRAGIFRRALAKVREAEQALQARRRELEAATEQYLGAYLAPTITWFPEQEQP